MDLLLAAAEAPARIVEINGQGWATMLISVTSVLTLVTFCLYRVMTLPPVEEESVKGPLDIDTGDTVDAD